MTCAADRQPLCLRDLVGRHRVRPRVAEAKSGGFLFGSEFGRRLDDRPKRVAVFPGVFPVGVVNAPELMAGLRSHNRVQSHAASSAEHRDASVYRIHNMRGQSGYVRRVVTAKTQYSLTNAKNYFTEHLCVGDYYEEGQRWRVSGSGWVRNAWDWRAKSRPRIFCGCVRTSIRPPARP